jgi:exopolysaccharide biosynthesis polyprenyl glycosylphosphotransferase
MANRYQKIMLFLGDILMMYLALSIAVYLRGGEELLRSAWTNHISAYTLLHLVWLMLLYIDDFYAPRRFRMNTDFVQALLRVLLLQALAGTVFFYVVQAFGITPKVILLLHVLVFAILFAGWRWVAGVTLRLRAWRRPAVFLEIDDQTARLATELANDPYAPYKVHGVFTEVGAGFQEAARHPATDTVVVGNQAWQALPPEVFDLALVGTRVVDAATFWEEHHRRVPLHADDVSWFLGGFRDSRKGEYEVTKRLADFLVAAVLGLLLLPLMALIAVAVRLTSPGPALYRQIRTGRLGESFALYKFRTMRTDAEAHGPQWSSGRGDPRVTGLGRLLRHTHLDEIPQLWNILKGEMSFVGPRPERPEFVADLKEQLPYYSLRHLVRPGLTGWAQIHYRYGASVEDAAIKLSLDLWYVKNRTLALDLRIFLKTAAMVFRGQGR